jgi:outer membrane protein OmpA-like peptidoglycan-associated protein
VGAPEEGLADSQKQILITLASDFRTYLASNPAARLLLEGHADPRASVEYNQALSERRVGTARQILIGQGVPAGDITTRAFGEEQNLSDDQVRVEVTANPELTPEQRQKLLDNLATIILASNRRVDVMLTTTGQQSIRQYPFNAADSLTLLSQDAPR